MRQARASAAQAIKVRPEGHSPFATWCSVARYPTAASAEQDEEGDRAVVRSKQTKCQERQAEEGAAGPSSNAGAHRRRRVYPVRSSSCASEPRSPRREQRGGAGRSPGFDAQLGGEAAQVRRHVDVVPRLGEGHRQSERTRVPDEGIASVACAERRQIEEPRVHRGGANEVVAAVLRRSDHHLARVEKVEGRLEARQWKVRTVAVDRDDAAEGRDETFEDGGESGGQPAAALADDVRACWQAGLDDGHVLGGAHHGHVDTRKLLDQRQRVAQHAVRELDHVARLIRAGQSRLHESFPRGLRHHHDGVAKLSRSTTDLLSAHVAGPGSAGAVAERRRFFTMPVRMYQAAPIEPLQVPLIFETPMRG